jgi:hypothetical protein
VVSNVLDFRIFVIQGKFLYSRCLMVVSDAVQHDFLAVVYLIHANDSSGV